MKYLVLLMMILNADLSFSQNEAVTSAVYSFKNTQKFEDENRISTPFFKEKSTLFLENFSIHHTTLKPKHALRPSHIQKEQEELLIVNEGELSVTINGETKVLPAGSAFVILPGDDQMMNNLSASNTGYYVLIYKSKKSEQNKNKGKSQMYDFKETVFKAQDKGGRRDIMNRPTAMFDRLEMHTTYLNAGLQSHAPHQHLADEIILMLDGEATMNIDGKDIKAQKGDFYYLPSNCLHGITNTGKSQASYMAFQFN